MLQNIRSSLRALLQQRPSTPSDVGLAREADRYHHFFKSLGHDSTNEWIRKSATINGWLFPGEHELLWKLGLDSPAGHVLEVGTWMGKSACILAGTCRARGDGSKVFCVDPFDLRGTEWQQDFHRAITGSAPSTFEQFVANARRLDFYAQVLPIAKASEEVIGLLPTGFRMVFLDGWHDYDHVALEVGLVTPRIVAGGWLALHDATDDFPGVKKFASELATNSAWEPVAGAGTIAVFRRR